MKKRRVRTPIIPVLEVFGPTIQGEGMVIGQKTMFVRTAGCDYACSWCDSAFTWDGSAKDDIRRLMPDDVYEELLQVGSIEKDGVKVPNFNHVTISGGNPALIGEPMKMLIDRLHADDIKVGLETQGSRWQEWFYDVDDLTISPKPPSSGMVTDFDKLDEIVRNLYGKSVNFTLKVVIFDEVDFEYAKKIYKRYDPDVFYVSVGNKDAAEDGDISGRLLTSLDNLWEMVLSDPDANDWRALPQLHTLVWANKRGV